MSFCRLWRTTLPATDRGGRTALDHHHCTRGVAARCRRLVNLSFTFTLTALLHAIAAPPVHAQNPTPGWDGSLEVTPSSLTIRQGESDSYSLKLSDPPTANGWWVRVHVDGAVRADGEYDANGDGDADITWVPSVGWEFNQDNWEQSISIHVTDDAPVGTEGDLHARRVGSHCQLPVARSGQGDRAGRRRRRETEART